MDNVKAKPPDMIFRNGKPTAVILDIDDYTALLERLEDADDQAELEQIRKQPLEFKSLNDFLKEYSTDV